MANNYPDNKLSPGLTPLAYLGVRHAQVPQIIYRNFAPTPQDWQNFNLGAIWINYQVDAATFLPEAWILLSLEGNVANWQRFSGSSGALIGLTGDTGTALPTGGFIKISGTTNQIVTTASLNPGTVNLAFANSKVVYTPVLTFGGLAVGITYAVQTGIYYRLGNLLTFSFRITLTSKGSSTGVASVSGLPIGASIITCFPALTSQITYAGELVGQASTSNILLNSVSSTGVFAPIDDTAFANTSDFTVSGSYLV